MHSRRAFLRLVGLTLAGISASSCAPQTRRSATSTAGSIATASPSILQAPTSTPVGTPETLQTAVTPSEVPTPTAGPTAIATANAELDKLSQSIEAFKTKTPRQISEEMKRNGVRFLGTSAPVAVDIDGRPITTEVRPGYFYQKDEPSWLSYCIQGPILGTATVEVHRSGSSSVAIEFVVLGIVNSIGEMVALPIALSPSDVRCLFYLSTVSEQEYGGDTGIYNCDATASQVKRNVLEPNIGKYSVVSLLKSTHSRGTDGYSDAEKFILSAANGSSGQSSMRIGKVLKDGYSTRGADSLSTLGGQEGLLEVIQQTTRLPGTLTGEQFGQLPYGSRCYIRTIH